MYQDLWFGLKMWGKNPGVTLIAIVTLALGIGANTAVFSVVKGVVLRPLPYPEANQLVMVWESAPRRGIEQEGVSPANFADWRAQQRVFSHLSFWSPQAEFNLVGDEGSEKVQCSYASSSLFLTLGVSPLLGRGFLAEEDLRGSNRVAVISHEFWRRRYAGNPSAIGQGVTLDSYGRRDYRIVGVMPPGFQFPGRTEIWLSAGWNGLPQDRRGGHWLSVLGRLDAGISIERAQAEMNVIQSGIERQFPDHGVGSHVAIVPLLKQTVGRNLERALLVLWGVIASVMLIACANVANLLLARSAARRKEIGIRLALGAGRLRIVRQMLTESALLGLAGGAAGLVLAYCGLELMKATSAGQVPRLNEVRLDGGALVFTLLVSLLTSAICGLAPAFQATKGDLNDALKDGGRGASTGWRGSRLRRLLVVAEVALSLILLVGAGLMLNSFARLTGVDRGFESDRLVVAKLDFSVTGFTTWVRPTATRPQVALQELIERLNTQPGIKSAAAISGLPRGDLQPGQRLVIEGRESGPKGSTPTASFHGITPDFFQTLGIRLLQGRSFTERDTFEAPAVVIVNETFARRHFPDLNPIGRRLGMEGRTPGQIAGPNPNASTPWSEIVGVMSDTKKLNLNADTAPEIYAPYWQWPMQSPELLVRAEAPVETVAAVIRREVKALDRGLPGPKIQAMEEMLSEVVAQPRFQTQLMALFGLLALTLAAGGIYSVISYSVAQRTQEIGIRLALGATSDDVLKLVIGQGMKLALAGALIGLGGSLLLTRLMETLLYGVGPRDPATFGAITTLLLFVALVACYLPARRATKVDPLAALRRE